MLFVKSIQIKSTLRTQIAYKKQGETFYSVVVYNGLFSLMAYKKKRLR